MGLRADYCLKPTTCQDRLWLLLTLKWIKWLSKKGVDEKWRKTGSTGNKEATWHQCQYAGMGSSIKHSTCGFLTNSKEWPFSLKCYQMMLQWQHRMRMVYWHTENYCWVEINILSSPRPALFLLASRLFCLILLVTRKTEPHTGMSSVGKDRRQCIDVLQTVLENKEAWLWMAPPTWTVALSTVVVSVTCKSQCCIQKFINRKPNLKNGKAGQRQWN